MLYLAIYWLTALALLFLASYGSFFFVKRIFLLDKIDTQTHWRRIASYLGLLFLIPVAGLLWAIYLIHVIVWKRTYFSIWKSIGVVLTCFMVSSMIIASVNIVNKMYGFWIFRTSGSSMEKNFHDWQFLLLNKFVYFTSEPRRFDIATVMPNVQNWKTYYIQRIIWLPGDHIKLENGWVYIKERGHLEFSLISEPYLLDSNIWKTFHGKSSTDTDFIVPEWQFFLLGDNRMASVDSRDCFEVCKNTTSHFVERTNIIGRVIE